ncbi:MAG: NAD(P)/FAD-dependent oxidoreductase [Gammaproteobacteria bacterium]
MNDYSRREFIKHATALSVAASGVLAFPLKSYAQSGRNVVIIGGGFGGATCAKYLRLYDPSSQVTLIEKQARYVTCPFSNTVLAGINQMDFITHNYSALSGHGVKVMQDTVTAVDPESKKVTTKGGQSLNYDRLVVSPGISFRWDAIEGYDAADAEKIPHAWQAGAQTELLKKQLESMKDGGVVVIAVPKTPFRAPPAPYERASMIAYYLNGTKPKSKVMILDANDDFEEHELMTQAWKKLYPGMIEWVKSGPVMKVDAGAMTVHTKDGQSHKGDVINVIPPQQAGEIARLAGLTDDTGWCPIDQKTFESKSVKGIHIIGDSCNAGEMAKAGSGANTQAKVCAAAIASEFLGTSMPDPDFVTVFYGLIGKKYAISNAWFYRYQGGEIKKVSGGLSKLKASKKDRRQEMKYAKGWYQSITSEAFG